MNVRFWRTAGIGEIVRLIEEWGKPDGAAIRNALKGAVLGAIGYLIAILTHPNDVSVSVAIQQVALVSLGMFRALLAVSKMPLLFQSKIN